MSDQPVGARSFLTTTEPLRQDLLTPTMIAAVGVCAILVIAGIGAALRGPWLDEFWTLELSDASRGLPALIRDGWMRDAHPPVFNAWATLLASLGITSIPAGRLVSNLLAAGLMILAAFRLSRRTPSACRGGRPGRPVSPRPCCCSPCRCRRRWSPSPTTDLTSGR
jgi:hypothetical protein